MSEELFDVVFFGILQAGKDKDTVMQNMAKIFKTDAARLAPYFAGGRKVIKGKVNAEMAAKYQAALENAGLVIKLEACAAITEEDSAATTPASSAAKQQRISLYAASAAARRADLERADGREGPYIEEL